MFYLIGIGLNPKQVTLEAKEAIESCSRVFFEAYTSCYSEGSIAGLEELTGKRFIELRREGVEEGFGLVLKEAKREDTALLVFGNPLNATTHLQLLLDAQKLGVETRIVAGLSIFDFVGKSGLDPYRFGRTCTIVFPKENYAPESFYGAIEGNSKRGLHSLCLLDFDAEGNAMMSVGEALAILEKIEKKRGGGILERAVLVGFYGVGSSKEKIKAGALNELKRSSYAAFPQSLVIAGKLTEKEREALIALAGLHD
jgi:diphthine synthase